MCCGDEIGIFFQAAAWHAGRILLIQQESALCHLVCRQSALLWGQGVQCRACLSASFVWCLCKQMGPGL